MDIAWTCQTASKAVKKRQLNNGRPPDTSAELLKSPNKCPRTGASVIRFGPPSYKWSNNSCWLDSSLEITFICVAWNFNEFTSLFDTIPKNSALYAFFNTLWNRFKIDEDTPDETTTRMLMEHRDNFRKVLLDSELIRGLETSESLLVSPASLKAGVLT